MKIIFRTFCLGFLYFLLGGCVLPQHKREPVQNETFQPPSSRPLPAELQQLIDQKLKLISDRTGLKVKRPVQASMVKEEALVVYLQHLLATEYPQHHMQFFSAALAQLGLLDEAVDLRKHMLDLYIEEVVGFYDSKSKLMYLLDRPDQKMNDHSFVLHHELTHALQDQRRDLYAYMHSFKLDEDPLLATQAAIEGEGVWAMSESLFPESMREPDHVNWILAMTYFVRKAYQDSPAFQAAPEYLQTQIMFTYLQGLEFVNQYYKQVYAKTKRPLMDALPQSTEQILHFDRYLAGDKPISVKLPRLPAPLNQWQQRLELSLGELNIRTLFDRFLKGFPNAQSAEGWGGDRFGFYQAPDGKQSLLVWASEWDSPEDAAEFEQAYRLLLKAKLPQAVTLEEKVHDAHRTYLIIEHESDLSLVQRDQRKVLIIEGMPSKYLDLLKQMVE